MKKTKQLLKPWYCSDCKKWLTTKQSNAHEGGHVMFHKSIAKDHVVGLK